MSVRFFGRGDHPGGFIGFRVARSFDGRFRNDYFSTSHLDNSNPGDRRQIEILKLKAEIRDMEWKAEAALAEYQRFVSLDHPNCKPFRGVGVHCITAEFDNGSTPGARYNPGFRVRLGRKTIFVNFKEYHFTKAWEKAVTIWSEHHDIQPGDAQRVQKNVPDPGQFKLLRAQMIKEGVDIPVSVLREVFAEQRLAIKVEKSKLSEKAKAIETSKDLSSFTEGLMSELKRFSSTKTKPKQECRT